jgi:hypothetical protein
VTAKVQADLQTGLEAYQTGDYETAHREFLAEAEHGNADAQYHLGYMYWYGLGIEKDREEAIKWSKKSANQGNERGKDFLGFIEMRLTIEAKSHRPDSKKEIYYSHFLYYLSWFYFASFIWFYVRNWKWLKEWKILHPKWQRTITRIQRSLMFPFVESCIYVWEFQPYYQDAHSKNFSVSRWSDIHWTMLVLLIPRLYFITANTVRIRKGTRQLSLVDDDSYSDIVSVDGSFFRRAKIQVAIMLLFSAIPMLMWWFYLA